VPFDVTKQPIADLGYDFTYGEPQPSNGYHLARENDPWARDGIAKRGSFTVERKVEQGLQDRFWLVITGTPGNEIRCSVRTHHHGRSTLKFSYESKTAIVSDLLPCIHHHQFDTVTCNDLSTGERRYFVLEHWEPEHEKPVEPWETDQAARWMKSHGLSVFTPSSAPLHGTSYEAKEAENEDNSVISPGEEWMYRTGHMPIYHPPYQEEMGGHLTTEQAREEIPRKQDYKDLLQEDMSWTNRNRAWRSYWKAWQAGLDKDKKDGVPKTEWHDHWN